MKTGDHPDYASQPVEAALAAVGSVAGGLSQQEAARRLALDGSNTLPSRRPGFLRLLARQFRNAVLLLLLGTAVAAGLLGELQDAVIIAVVLLVSVGLGFASEYRAERTTAALQDRISHSALVKRSGLWVTTPTSELVVGDIVHLRAGAMVPADLRLIEVNGLVCEEAALTGESLGRAKSVAEIPEGTPLGDRTSCCYMGTVVRGGDGDGVVVATGASTWLGGIAEGLSSRVPETAFQTGLRRYSYLLLGIAVLLIAVIIVTGTLSHRPLLDSMLFALAIAVGVTPQLLPAIVSTSLAFGARGLARRGVLVKRLVCIEDLGNITTLISDKTGTLTVGTVSFHSALSPEGHEAPDVLELARLALGGAGAGDDVLDAQIADAASAAPDGRCVDRLPFDHDTMLAWSLIERAGTRLLVARGAPEAILSRCPESDPDARRTLAGLYASGLRTIAVAVKEEDGEVAAPGTGLTLVGFLTFLDPLRTDSRAALSALSRLGVRLLIATGDSAEVAQTLTAQVLPEGPDGPGDVLIGTDLEKWSDRELADRLRTASVIARVTPQQKERIVRVLRVELHETVGFLGDGVNDALALHQADVGISVSTAVDIAKDAADVVMQEKSLSVLADGIAGGRRVFANTIKYVLMAGSSNLGNMVSAAAASSFLGFLPLLPEQVLLSNLLYDSSQLALPADRVDAEQLRMPSRWDLGLVARYMLVFGLVSSVFDFMTFALLLGGFGASHAEFRTGWFVESLTTQALVVLVIRTRRYPFVRSRPAWQLAAALFAAVAVAWTLPLTPVGSLLGFTPLPLPLAAGIVALTVGYLVVVDLVKRIFFAAEERGPRTSGRPPRALERALHNFRGTSARSLLGTAGSFAGPPIAGADGSVS